MELEYMRDPISIRGSDVLFFTSYRKEMATYHQMCTSSDFHEGEVTEM
jgi:hypothetical protein